VVRHHSEEWLRELLESFEMISSERFAAMTMRGNPAAGFRFFGRR